MKRVSVSEIYKPQILAKPIITASGSVLLYEGAELRSDQVKRLIDNGISEVYIEDYGQDDKAGIVEIESVEGDSAGSVRNILNRFTGDNSEINDDIKNTTISIIDKIISNKEVTGCMLNVKHNNSDIYTHMLDVASMSVIMGIKCGFSEEQLRNTALGALLHDVGINYVTVPYINVEVDRFSATDKLNYRKHVIHGYEMLHNYPWMTETAKMIVLSHHERMDGSGYPFHKPGERIEPEVRLVAICDHISELINGIGYTARKIHEAIEYFRTAETYLFDYQFMNNVIKNIAWYPNGSLVKTNEGEEGTVISQNRGLPDRPVIKIIRNADGTPNENGAIKDLTECHTLFLTDIVE